MGTKKSWLVFKTDTYDVAAEHDLYPPDPLTSVLTRAQSARAPRPPTSPRCVSGQCWVWPKVASWRLVFIFGPFLNFYPFLLASHYSQAPKSLYLSAKPVSGEGSNTHLIFTGINLIPGIKKWTETAKWFLGRKDWQLCILPTFKIVLFLPQNSRSASAGSVNVIIPQLYLLNFRKNCIFDIAAFICNISSSSLKTKFCYHFEEMFSGGVPLDSLVIWMWLLYYFSPSAICFKTECDGDAEIWFSAMGYEVICSPLSPIHHIQDLGRVPFFLQTGVEYASLQADSSWSLLCAWEVEANNLGMTHTGGVHQGNGTGETKLQSQHFTGDEQRWLQLWVNKLPLHSTVCASLSLWQVLFLTKALFNKKISKYPWED